MKTTVKRFLIGILWGVGLLSCSGTEEMVTPSVSTTFDLTLQSETRAPESLNTSTHTAKVYLFREETSGSGRYVYFGEQSITSNRLTVSGLVSGTKYRFVFLAVPRNQQPSLPALTASKPSYTEALLTYVSGSQPTNEVFRNLLTFTATADLNAMTIVLTRQNGALQIRLNNADGWVRSMKLEVSSLPQMYFHDGTGGQVLTAGTSLVLSKSMQAPRSSDCRISVYVLPAEDLTGKGRLTLTYWTGQQSVYTLQSTSGRIPVYPNQVTWLLLDESCRSDAAASAESSSGISSGEDSGISPATFSTPCGDPACFSEGTDGKVPAFSGGTSLCR